MPTPCRWGGVGFKSNPWLIFTFDDMNIQTLKFEILRMSQQEFRNPGLSKRSNLFLQKQICVNNPAYPSCIAQDTNLSYYGSNLLPRKRKKKWFLPEKQLLFQDMQLYDFQPPVIWGLVGFFFYKCKYNDYLCLSVHPKMAKDNTMALK